MGRHTVRRAAAMVAKSGYSKAAVQHFRPPPSRDQEDHPRLSRHGRLAEAARFPGAVAQGAAARSTGTAPGTTIGLPAGNGDHSAPLPAVKREAEEEWR